MISKRANKQKMTSFHSLALYLSAHIVVFKSLTIYHPNFHVYGWRWGKELNTLCWMWETFVESQIAGLWVEIVLEIQKSQQNSGFAKSKNIKF